MHRNGLQTHFRQQEGPSRAYADAQREQTLHLVSQIGKITPGQPALVHTKTRCVEAQAEIWLLVRGSELVTHEFCAVICATRASTSSRLCRSMGGSTTN